MLGKQRIWGAIPSLDVSGLNFLLLDCTYVKELQLVSLATNAVGEEQDIPLLP